MNRPAIAILGTLDTKGVEVAYLRDVLTGLGARVEVIDVGVLGEPAIEPEVTRAEVAAAAGTDLAELVRHSHRAEALMAMGSGAGRLLSQAAAIGDCGGVVAIGGSGGTAAAVQAFTFLPFGLPKILVSTQVSSFGDVLARASDVILVAAIADLAGLNRITRRVLTTAAGAVLGASDLPSGEDSEGRPVFATMLGLTTRGVEAARHRIEATGIEVVTFHATGSGGRTMESLIPEMRVAGMLDLTTVELADEIVGGVKSAGPERLKAAGNAGIPQVVSTGGLDMVRFGPMDTVPERFRGRRLHAHSDMVTLMRTTQAECRAIGRAMGETLSQASGPVHVLVPSKGFSALSTPEGPFYDPEADRALLESLEETTSKEVNLAVYDTDINDPAFAAQAADSLLAELRIPTR